MEIYILFKLSNAMSTILTLDDMHSRCFRELPTNERNVMDTI